MSNLLSRYAEAMFWLARYIERAENMARILDVQQTFSRDSKGTHDWGSVLALNADQERFFKVHPAATARAVLHFYVLDRDNPSSIVSDLRYARENARMLRPLISTEMWVQINVFHNRVQGLGPEVLAEDRVTRLATMIKEGCDAHVGVTAGTFYRDEAWNFYQIGAALECADQTTRLLDVKFYALVAGGRPEPGSPVDVSQWNALLRSASAFQAFRRRHPREMTPEQVALFVMCDHHFPRSVAYCLGVIEENLTKLRREYNLRGTSRALEHIDDIRDNLDVAKVIKVISNGGLHRFIDWLQTSFIALSGEIGRSFFGHQPPVPEEVETVAAALVESLGASQTQTKSQTS